LKVYPHKVNLSLFRRGDRDDADEKSLIYIRITAKKTKLCFKVELGLSKYTSKEIR
jgi:hypothetical protein